MSSTDRLTLICPKGDEYGTVADYPDNMVYTEVTKAQWALFAINARSMNVTGDIGSYQEHTLWRSSIPAIAFNDLAPDTKVGKESSSTYFNTGEYVTSKHGFLPFAQLPWIAVRYELDAPAPESSSFLTPSISPTCFIVNGKFYIGVGSFGLDISHVEMNGNTFSHFRTIEGNVYQVDCNVTSTFY